MGAARGAPTGANPADDIHDIHGPISIPARLPVWWYVAGAGAAVVAAGGAALSPVAGSAARRRTSARCGV